MKNPRVPYLPQPHLQQYHDEDRYKALVENSIHAYFLVNPAGNILEANHIALKMFGYSKKEILSLNKKNIFDHTDDNLVLALQENEKYNYVSLEAMGIKKNGERFPIELSSVIFTDTLGNAKTSIMVFDCSERKITENRYLKKLKLLQQTEQITKQGSWEWNLTSGTLDCSEEFFRIIGISPVDFNASISSLQQLIHPDDKAAAMDAFSGIQKTTVASSIKFKILTPTNVPKLIECKMKATAAKKVAGTWQDITEKEKQRVELKNVIESITDGFFILDNDWIITYWNKAVADMSGISSDEMVGQSFLDYFKDMENLKFYSECRLSKQENISVHFEEYYPPANMWIKVNAYPSENGLTVFCKNISRQKSAEVAMKLSNDRYNMIVNATNDLVWDWDIITGEIDRNCHGVRRVYGHDSNDSIRTNQLWAAHIHPLDKERIDRLIAYYISSENESSFNFEYRFRREDGEYNYIDDNGYIIRNELGIVTRMIGAARDVTESKKNAQSIEESEQRYKLFVQQNTDAIWRIELNDAQPVDTPTEELMQYCLTNAYVAECNDAFAKTYGFDNAEKIIGLPLKEILSPENTSSIQFLRKFLENNFKVADEISRGYDNAGNRLIFLNNMSGIIENGHIKRAWGTQRNITQQKLTEESLLASEEQYRYLFNNNPACIFIWDFETLQFIEVNQSAVELYNYSREEFLQMTILDMKLPEDHDTVKEMVEIARTQESYKKTGISRHIDKTGRTIYIEMTSHNIMYKGRKSALAIGNNVTEKIQLENSLNEERKLRQAQITDAVITGQERERSELAEELHDNINQILASTRLYIECAMSDDHVRKDLLDRGRILLDSAMKEIRKLSRTLLPPALDEVSLLEALNDMVEDIQLVNPIDIYRNWDNFTEEAVSPKLKLTIFRIVQEQLNNIHKHAKATKVFINLERQGDFINLSIKDDGIGFNTLTKKTGVGLRNISSRAEVNNGKVQIQSTPGKGCELKVCFPLNV